MKYIIYIAAAIIGGFVVIKISKPLKPKPINIECEYVTKGQWKCDIIKLK